MTMMHLCARDALTDKLVKVLANQRPRDFPQSSNFIRAVFSEESGHFLGLVEDTYISRYPQRIFADLLSFCTEKPVAADTPLRNIAVLFEKGRRAVAVVDGHGEFLGAVTYTSLLNTLLRWNESALHKTEELLGVNRRLMQRLLSAQEEERLQLARDLHDEMGQYCAAIIASVQVIVDLNQGANNQIHECCLTIMDLCGHVHKSIQAMLRRLRPNLLDEVGLTYALQDLVATWSRNHAGINCKLAMEGALDDMDENINIVVYRIVQECLTNIVRHAQATQVMISLTRGKARILPEKHRSQYRDRGDMLILEVRDNGQGMSDANQKTGLGLAGIQERALSLGGEVEIESMPGKGVSITTILPVIPKKKEETFTL